MDTHSVSLHPLRSTDPEILGRHRPVGRLGSGGMGVVYLAEGPLGRVAVKLIRAEFADDPEFRVRFQREVQACFRLGGAHTARLVDFELDADRPWLATEFVDAPDLAAQVKVGGPLSVADQLALAVGLAEALASIHAAGLVHRDLKPSNVLWTQDGPKVIDFGIAAAADARPLTVTGAFVGTPGWLSPEQAAGGEVTAATDVFAWGGLVCFAATGEPPFGTGPSAAVLHRLLYSDPSIDDDRLAPVLRDPVRQGMARQPDQRPSARDLLEALTGNGQAMGADRTRRLEAPGQGATVATVVLPEEAARGESAGGTTPPGPAGGATPAGPTRVARQRMPRRRALAYAAVAVVILALAGTLGAVLAAGGDDASPGSASGTPSEAPASEQAEGEEADFTADAPWRLVIRDEIEGEDNGCAIKVTNIETGVEAVSVTDIYGTVSYQVQDTGSFSWDVNDPGCLVVGRSGPGAAVLPFTQEAYAGDTDAFEPQAMVAVEVLDFQGGEECEFVLRDAADGREVDFGTVRSDSNPLLLDPNGRSLVYLADVPCGVQVSAG